MPGYHRSTLYEAIRDGIEGYREYKKDPKAYWEQQDRKAAPYLWIARILFILIIGGALVNGLYQALR